MEKLQDRYYSIPYITEKRLSLFSTSDYIYVEEKLDGSNASFNIDEQGNLRIYGRNYELNNTSNTLNGCYEWAHNLDFEKLKSVIGTKYTIYFEWLAKKKHIEYPSDKYQKGYIFSVKDNSTGKYLNQDRVYEIAKELGIDTVPKLYEGKFISWEHLMEFVGKSKLRTDGTGGEGIVIKSDTINLNKRIQSAPGQRMLKIVAEEFKESANIVGGTDFNKLNKRQQDMTMVKSIVTHARIEKAVYRVLEEDNSTHNLDELSKSDLVALKRRVISNIYKDCLKEEKDLVEKIGKPFGSILNITVEEWINELKIGE